MTTDPCEMEQRLRELGRATTWQEAGPAAEEAWNAPYGPAEDWDLRIDEAEAPGPHGPIPLRVYTPTTPTVPVESPRPALVWCHGGSFQHGDLDMPEGDRTARGVAGRSGAVVVSVDYRLCDEPSGGAPARRFPGPVLDVRAPIPRLDVHAAVRWVREQAATWGIDSARIALGGASAGGNLAASASLQLAQEGAAPAASLLLYPVCHPLNPQATAEEAVALAELPAMLRFSPQKMRVMAENYLGRPLEEATAHDFPGVGSAEQLASLPRTYLEADEYDDLRCSARGYAEQLREAGVDVEYEVRRGVTHGHLNKVGLSQAAATMDRMASILEEL
ncbi:alpha/beta hydrolase [Brachybacterium sacelli]|uniref:Xylan 1,4-beta-xylosidase n=1 Tax=Brachybacterium sacelli TaxID=173364 RepID=A0ABS4WW64_9MICO|nr:alpha/beta hydrolase fold domain-containing protein [Brachybacterium sacelli]MBP2380388.1 xylan 1,4-beta-xylosidase [Brachybacterium sacelli]